LKLGKYEAAMREIATIKKLIAQANTLPLDDSKALRNLKKRAEVTTSKIFGDNHEYLYELMRINVVGPDDVRLIPIDYETLWYDAQSKMIDLFDKMLKELEDSGVPHPTNQPKSGIKNSNRVFIVHGHDETMKQTVARTIERLGLVAIILHEQPNKGRTIIQKFIEYSDVGFAVVLLSPDDIAFSGNDTDKNAKARVRQNVIFELGFFIGHLGSDRVFSLYKEGENLELPSDYSGVLYTPFDEAGQWRFELVKELKAAGYGVDANKLI
jgi:predicted nucleotide-binding protein